MKLNLSSAVTPKRALYEVDAESFDGTRVIWFLEKLLEEVPGRLMVIWDNGRIHRSIYVKTFLWLIRKRLETRRFPAYAPELDPDEMAWSTLKYQRPANFCPTTGEELRAAVERELRPMQRHPDLVGSFIRHSDCRCRPYLRELFNRKEMKSPRPFITHRSRTRTALTGTILIGSSGEHYAKSTGRRKWKSPLEKLSA